MQAQQLQQVCERQKHWPDSDCEHAWLTCMRTMQETYALALSKPTCALCRVCCCCDTWMQVALDMSTVGPALYETSTSVRLTQLLTQSMSRTACTDACLCRYGEEDLMVGLWPRVCVCDMGEWVCHMGETYTQRSTCARMRHGLRLYRTIHNTLPVPQRGKGHRGKQTSAWTESKGESRTLWQQSRKVKRMHTVATRTVPGFMAFLLIARGGSIMASLLLMLPLTYAYQCATRYFALVWIR